MSRPAAAETAIAFGSLVSLTGRKAPAAGIMILRRDIAVLTSMPALAMYPVIIWMELAMQRISLSLLQCCFLFGCLDWFI